MSDWTPRPTAGNISALASPDKTRAYRSLFEEHQDLLAERDRLREAVRYASAALSEMEVDLLKMETCDRDAHRLNNIQRGILRKAEGT